MASVALEVSEAVEALLLALELLDAVCVEEVGDELLAALWVVEVPLLSLVPGMWYFLALPPIGTPKNTINKTTVHIHKQQAKTDILLLVLPAFLSIDSNNFFALNYSLCAFL